MSEAHALTSTTLARLSEDLVAPYRAYQEALRYRHELSGVDSAALQADAEEAESYGQFVTSAVKLLPPVEVADVSPVRTNRRLTLDGVRFQIPGGATAFRTPDSVRAEALWGSTIWDGTMPYYVIGSDQPKDKDGASTLAVAMAPLTLADEATRREWLHSSSEYRNSSRLGLFAQRKLATLAFSDAVGDNRPLTYRTWYNKSSGYGRTELQLVERNLNEETVALIGINRISGGLGRGIGQNLLNLAGDTASEAYLAAQSDRLRKIYDPDQKQFVMTPATLPNEAPRTDGQPSSFTQVFDKRLDGRQMVDFQIAERLTVLAVRFGKLEAYSALLDNLLDRIAEIRGGTLLPGSSEAMRTDYRSKLAESIFEMLQQAQQQEVEKQGMARRFGRMLGIGR